MGRTGAGLVLGVLVVAALGAGYLAVSSGRQASTSTSTSHSAPTSTSSIGQLANTTASVTSSSGLELRIDLNSTTMQPGGSLAANVTLSNTLDESLSLLFPLVSPPGLNNSISSWDNYDFLCGEGGPVSYLAGFALLKGHFVAANVSQAPAPLQLAAVADLPSCGGFVFPPGERVTFLPNSSKVEIPGSGALSEQAALNVTTVSCIALPPGSSQCGPGLFGYWNTTSSICCPPSSNDPQYFRYLTPGTYTLVAQDVWNQTAYAYFQVSPGPSAAAVGAEESPFSNPGAAVIGLTLANFATVPMSSLNATLRFVPSNSSASLASYPFAFNVNSSSPLTPGQTVEDVETLHSDLFDIGVSYPLAISGTFPNGTEFTYTQQVQFVNDSPSW